MKNYVLEVKATASGRNQDKARERVERVVDYARKQGLEVGEWRMNGNGDSPLVVCGRCGAEKS